MRKVTWLFVWLYCVYYLHWLCPCLNNTQQKQPSTPQIYLLVCLLESFSYFVVAVFFPLPFPCFCLSNFNLLPSPFLFLANTIRFFCFHNTSIISFVSTLCVPSVLNRGRRRNKSYVDRKEKMENRNLCHATSFVTNHFISGQTRSGDPRALLSAFSVKN